MYRQWCTPYSWPREESKFTQKVIFSILNLVLEYSNKPNTTKISRGSQDWSHQQVPFYKMKRKKVWFLKLKFPSEWPLKLLKLYGKRWPKFEQVSKKSTDPADVGTSSFRWINHVWYFCFQMQYKAKLGLYSSTVFESRVIKSGLFIES